MMIGCAPAGDPMGTITLNLTGNGDSGLVYRLRDAVITVTGPTSTQVWRTEDNPDRTSLSADVDVGDYSALLPDGWRIEQVSDVGAMPVSATLVSDNPALFTVTAGHRTTVPLLFRVDGDTVDLSAGYDITLGIQETPLLAVANTGDNPGPAVMVFSAVSRNPEGPRRSITGPATGLLLTGGIAFAAGELIVTNFDPPTINAFTAGATGDVAPLRTITGVAAESSGAPFDIHVSGDEIFVGVGPEIQVFPRRATGPVPPLRRLTPRAGSVNRFAVDDHGALYLAWNVNGTPGIAVFPPMASGDQPPDRTIVASDGDLCPRGLAVHDGLLYIADACRPGVVVVPQQASGSVAPVRVLAGPNTGLEDPVQLAFFGDELYVLDFTSADRNRAVRVYPLGAAGDVAPTRTLARGSIPFPLGLVVY
jgi:hypothetical protein